MIEAVVLLLTTLIGYWLKRKFNREQNKTLQLEDALHEIDKAISKGDTDSINRTLELNLRRLSHRHRDRRQQTSPATPKK